MAENLANEFQTTLAAAITGTGDTSISLSSTAGAPAPNYRIRIDDELMLVTAVSGSGPYTATVTRGVEGTTAATHSNGATVTHVLTAGGLTQYVSEHAGGSAGLPMTTSGDLLYQGDETTIDSDHNASSATGNVLVVTGNAETLLPGCDITVDVSTAEHVALAWDVWSSQNRNGVVKGARIRLRRDDVSGEVLVYSDVPDGGVDSSSGHAFEWDSTYDDTGPTSGHYVLTIQETAGDSLTELWSDTRTFTADALGGGALRLPIGDEAEVLGVASGLPAWGSRSSLQLTVDEDGSSFTNFTSQSGTWASTGGIIQQTQATSGRKVAKYNSPLALAHAFFEAEVRLPTGGSAVRGAGLFLGYPGTGTNGYPLLQLADDSPDNYLSIQRESVAAPLQVNQTVALDTWYRIACLVNGDRYSIYLDGALVGTAILAISDQDASYFALASFDGTVDYRNIKVWTEALPY